MKNTLRKIFAIIAFAAVSFTAVGCAAPVDEVTGICLDKTEVTVQVGDEVSVAATVTYVGEVDKNVTWTVDDASIATFTNGKIKGEKVGTTKVKATIGSFTNEIKVTVVAVPDAPTPTLEVTKTGELNQVIGSTAKVTFKATTTHIAEPVYKWYVDGKLIETATTDSYELPAATGVGTRKVKVEVGSLKSEEFSVVVIKKEQPAISDLALEIPAANITTNSITIDNNPNSKDFEFKVFDALSVNTQSAIDAIKWTKFANATDDLVFDNLKSNREYVVMARKAETTTEFASAPIMVHVFTKPAVTRAVAVEYATADYTVGAQYNQSALVLLVYYEGQTRPTYFDLGEQATTSLTVSGFDTTATRTGVYTMKFDGVDVVWMDGTTAKTEFAYKVVAAASAE